MRAFLNRLVLLAAAAALFSSAAQAETYVKQVTSTAATKAFGTEVPASSDTSEFWISSDRYYMKDELGNGVLYIATEGKIYLIDHQAKRISDMTIGPGGIDVAGMLDPEAMEKQTGKKMSEQEKQAMRDMGAQLSGLATGMMASITFNVTPTSESKTIRDWSTTKYDYTMDMAGMKTTGSMWASEDIDIDYAAYQKLMYSKMASSPGFAEIMKEAAKVKGFPVYMEAKGEAMGMKVDVTTEVVEVADKPAPAGIFELPKGYSQSGK